MSLSTPIGEYISQISRTYQRGNATEHSYRGYLQTLLSKLLPDIDATNEPKRIACGAPDFLLSRSGINIGYIETKDIGDTDLEGKKKTGNKEQFDRYKDSLTNLIISDYLRFDFYQEGTLVDQITIATYDGHTIRPLPDSYDRFVRLLTDFCTYVSQTITDPPRLAQMMAGKARLLADVIDKALTSDEETKDNTTLHDQLTAFRDILIKDIGIPEFADIYAQTIAYGMFAARLHDRTPDTFNRQEAAELIPKSNPFLRKLFGYIAGPEIDDRIVWIVDHLTQIFLACNVKEILDGYGKETDMEDPVIHFYETFLAAYNPNLRKARGVWYTPAPVVRYIVRAVDDILKTHFGLPDGIADASKTTIRIRPHKDDPPREVDVHRVQILDPATGTGTFVSEIIRQVHSTFEGMAGGWSSYVEQDLLPRLHGFELLMASYAMAHLQIDRQLADTKFHPTEAYDRLRIYLTNSLEEALPHQVIAQFATWLAQEANEANEVKRNMPVMCVLGNPPYSGESANTGAWITRLMEDYKKEPASQTKLKEKNSKWINDDYVKFIRYGHHYIEKNKSGVLAYITPHGYLDNPTFRGMRWRLLRDFDTIYTIDLHGNARKKETAPDGSTDQNVFDIMQGVSINLFVKTGKKEKKGTNALARVYHHDLYGTRQHKYDFLNNNTIETTPFTKLKNVAPQYFFVPKDYELQKKYGEGFKVNELFRVNGVGLTTAHDEFVINENRVELLERFKKFQLSPKDAEFLHMNFNVKKKKGWDILKGYDNIINDKNLGKYIECISYRPFDNRYVFYEDKLVWRTVRKVMQHFIKGENVGLVVSRQCVGNWKHVFCTKFMTDFNLTGTAGRFGSGYTCPLYLYPEAEDGQTVEETTRIPNLDRDIVHKIAKGLGLTFTPEPHEAESSTDTFAPIEILDYIYAVLHSPTYRQTYNEFLKIDFPSVPYPTDVVEFRALVEIGGELRRLHLLEATLPAEDMPTYPHDGTHEISRRIVATDWQITDEEQKTGRIWLNDTQYFDRIPLQAWEMYIGGYQPPQKWLKDRRGHSLSASEIKHYRHIIATLTRTHRLMQSDKLQRDWHAKPDQ